MAKIDWRSLTSMLSSLAEDDVKRLLDEEITTHRRSAIARRLHQRYSMLRAMRERAVIMAEIRQ